MGYDVSAVLSCATVDSLYIDADFYVSFLNLKFNCHFNSEKMSSFMGGLFESSMREVCAGGFETVRRGFGEKSLNQGIWVFGKVGRRVFSFGNVESKGF